jgi:TPR repeat protein
MGGEAASPEQLEQRCREAEYDACAALGWLAYASASGPGDALRVLELFDLSCERGAAEGCTGLGVAYFEGFGVAQSFERAVSSWQRACDLASGAGCAYLGIAHLFGMGTLPDAVRALGVWRRSCELGEPDGCRFAGDLHLQDGPTRDVRSALSFWERACALGDPQGCLALARQLYTGSHVAMNRAAALAWFERACSLGGAAGCVNAGHLYRYGEGMAADLESALGMYGRACELRDARGCQLADTVSALQACLAAGRSDCLTPARGRLDVLECTGEAGFGVVTLTHEQWAERHAAGVTELRELHTSLAQPAEVCTLEGELQFLMSLHCADGSRPFLDRERAHGSRRGNVGPGGRCGSTIDLYAVSCPEGTYEVFLDMYMCPPRIPSQSL